MTKYGKSSKVANAHVQNIMSLPQTNNANPQKINDLSENLLYSVQALDIMEKIREMNGYVRVTLDRLQGIRPDLVRNDDNYGAWMTMFSTNPYFTFSNVLSVILHSLSRNCFTIKNQIFTSVSKIAVTYINITITNISNNKKHIE